MNSLDPCSLSMVTSVIQPKRYCNSEEKERSKNQIKENLNFKNTERKPEFFKSLDVISAKALNIY